MKNTMKLLDSCGIGITGDHYRVKTQVRALDQALLTVGDFSDWKGLEKWIRDNDVRRWETVVREMSARVSKRNAMGEPLDVSDEAIDKHEREKWDKIKGLDRDSLPKWALADYDRLRDFYEELEEAEW